MTFTRFTWGDTGAWQIDRVLSVGGPTLAPAQRLHVFQASRASYCRAARTFSGASSLTRYTSRPVQSSRRSTLDAGQSALGQPEAKCAALIPIKNSARWWDLYPG